MCPFETAHIPKKCNFTAFFFGELVNENKNELNSLLRITRRDSLSYSIFLFMYCPWSLLFQFDWFARLTIVSSGIFDSFAILALI